MGRTMEADKSRGMADAERRGRGCMILCLLALVGHLVVLRIMVGGPPDPWTTLPWGLQAILLLCCLAFLWAAYNGNRFAFWGICISVVGGIIAMLGAVVLGPVPTLWVVFSVGMKGLVLQLLLSSETRAFLAYQHRRKKSSGAVTAGQE
jgi:hypothetical protein